jgi:hypothetical protein
MMNHPKTHIVKKAVIRGILSTGNVTEGDLAVKALPGAPMTPEEIKNQIKVVSEAAKATAHFTEDELEEAADRLWQVLYDYMEKRYEFEPRSFFNEATGIIVRTSGDEFVVIGDADKVTDAEILAMAGNGYPPEGWTVVE